MFWFHETITDFDAGQERIRARRYGVIEIVGGQFHAIRLRPWPKLVSLPEVWPQGSRYHAGGEPDRCLLFYNQPWRMPNFLALKYVISTAGTSYATSRAALTTLDAIAALKQTDAIVCDAGNLRLSDRLMARLGWEAHKPQRWHRNFIRRFYGTYPAAVVPQRSIGKSASDASGEQGCFVGPVVASDIVGALSA
ncbi:MAG TPA: hypothetical protein VGM76_04145 [Lacipirellulaceae bacterium]|jgi:hypothetical protein